MSDRQYFDRLCNYTNYLKWIKWWFFTIITFGIYVFWLNIKVTQWITKHTHFID